MRLGMQLGWGVDVSWVQEEMQGQHSTFWDFQEQAWVPKRETVAGRCGWVDRAGVKVLRRSRIWNLKGIWTMERRRHPKKASQCEWSAEAQFERGGLRFSTQGAAVTSLLQQGPPPSLHLSVAPFTHIWVSAHLWSKSCWLAFFPWNQPVHQPQTQLPYALCCSHSFV